MPTELHDFGWALHQIKAGKSVGRDSWIDGQFVFLVSGSNFQVNRPPLLGIFTEGTKISYLPHLDWSDGNGDIGPWPKMDDDILAEDWFAFDN